MKTAVNVILLALLFVLSLFVIGYESVRTENRVTKLERQIDQLTTAMPYALTWDRIDEVETAKYDELRPGNYILCFIDYKGKSVVAEYTEPYKPSIDDPTVEVETGKKYQPRYVRIFDVPEKVLDDWQWREIRGSPTLLRGTSCRAYSHQ